MFGLSAYHCIKIIDLFKLYYCLIICSHYQSDFNVPDFTAEDAFLSLGQQLQRQRQYEAWNSVSVFLKDQPDPAESNPELDSMLQNNAKEYTAQMQNVRCKIISASSSLCVLCSVHNDFSVTTLTNKIHTYSLERLA